MAQASEVQQKLMPKSDPQVDGFDIAGRSIWCDETGGDYYDFLYPAANGHVPVLRTFQVPAVGNTGFDPVYGARPLKRAIQQELENPLAQRILAGEFEPGQTIRVGLDEDMPGQRLHFRLHAGATLLQQLYDVDAAGAPNGFGRLANLQRDLTPETAAANLRDVL